MRTKGKMAQNQVLFFEYEVVGNGKQSNIERRVHPSCRGIPERLQRHYFFKRRIKKIYQE